MARCEVHDAAGRTQCRPRRARRAAAAGLLLFAGACAAEIPGATWRYYRPGNTGIQGDDNEAIFIGADGDPWIGGYDPGFEEGGVARLVQAENRWVNVSNIDHPVIGHPNLTGTTRVSDITADAAGQLWMVTWRGLLRMDPAIGGPSVVNLATVSPPLAKGGRDIDIAPDGSVWIALRGFGNAQGGVIRHRSSTSEWRYWNGGSTPQGGNGWPQLVWNVAHVAITSGPAAPGARRSAMRAPASGSVIASPTPASTTISTATSRSTRRADGSMPARTRAPASAA